MRRGGGEGQGIREREKERDSCWNCDSRLFC